MYFTYIINIISFTSIINYTANHRTSCHSTGYKRKKRCTALYAYDIAIIYINYVQICVITYSGSSIISQRWAIKLQFIEWDLYLLLIDHLNLLISLFDFITYPIYQNATGINYDLVRKRVFNQVELKWPNYLLVF